MEGEFRSSRPVAKATEILFLLASGPRQLTDISAATQVPKSTAHRLLQDLASQQLVVAGEDGMYGLGPGCFRLLDALSASTISFGVATRKAMQALRDTTGETAVIHVRIGHTRVVVEEAPSHETVKYVAGVGAMSPVHLGSAGKVLLAFLSDQERDDLVSVLPLREPVNGRLLDAASLTEELRMVRKQGYAESFGERIAGGAAVSVPLLDPEKKVVASVSVLGPQSRLPVQRLQEIRIMTFQAARDLQSALWPKAVEVASRP